MSLVRYSGIADNGGKNVRTTAITTYELMETYPGCTVTVYLAGTTTLATLYSDALNTPKANPFTSNVDASFFFFVAGGTYDIKFSGVGLSTPITTYGIVMALATTLDYNIEDFASFSAAIDAMPSTGATLVIHQPTAVPISKTVPSYVTLRRTGKGVLNLSDGVTLTIQGPLVSEPIKLFNNALGGIHGIVTFTGNYTIGCVYPQWWGAKGDGATDNSAMLTAAINSIQSVGGIVQLTDGLFNFSTGILLPSGGGVRIEGVSQFYSRLNYTGNGTAITIGTITDSALNYNNGLVKFRILATNPVANFVAAYGTSNLKLHDLEIEGTGGSSCTSRGILLDDANIGNQFTSIQNVSCKHIKTGMQWSGGGSLTVTAVYCVNFTAISDGGAVIAGSTGILIDGSPSGANGNGSVIIGGNLESLAIGIDYSGENVDFIGIRFEANTQNAVTRIYSSGAVFAFCQNWNDSLYSDASGNAHVFLGNVDALNPATIRPSVLGALTLIGKIFTQYSVSDSPIAGFVNTNATNGYGGYFQTAANDSTRYSLRALGNAGRADFTVRSNGTVEIPGLQIFANNAAAVAGGLSVGSLYRNGADPDHVCVVH